ncbi:MAG: hypothetical protein ACQESN_09835 [Thermotogota bacterium]
MKKLLVLTIVSLFALMSFAVQFGGGGPSVVYIPGDQVMDPLNNGFDFTDGIFAFGGGGMGRIGEAPIFMGGEGWEGYSNKDGVKYTASYGAFNVSSQFSPSRYISFDLGAGFGGYIQTLEVEQDGAGNETTDFVNGTSPYLNQISFDAFTFAPFAGITVSPLEFMSIFVRGQYIVGASFDGWEFENGERVENIDEKYIYFYNISAGFTFGF